MEKTFKHTIIITAFLLLFLSSFGQTNKNKANKELTLINKHIDTSKFAVIQFDKKDTWLFKNVKLSSLTLNEIEKVEISLEKCVNNYNREQQKQFETILKAHPTYKLKVENFVINLTKYKRQYFPVVNKKGEKEVWVNCFCNTWNKNWRKEMLKVEDGGNCYFNVIINLTKKSYYRLMVNGDA